MKKSIFKNKETLNSFLIKEITYQNVVVIMFPFLKMICVKVNVT